MLEPFVLGAAKQMGARTRAIGQTALVPLLDQHLHVHAALPEGHTLYGAGAAPIVDVELESGWTVLH